MNTQELPAHIQTQTQAHTLVSRWASRHCFPFSHTFRSLNPTHCACRHCAPSLPTSITPSLLRLQPLLWDSASPLSSQLTDRVPHSHSHFLTSDGPGTCFSKVYESQNVFQKIVMRNVSFGSVCPIKVVLWGKKA